MQTILIMASHQPKIIISFDFAKQTNHHPDPSPNHAKWGYNDSMNQQAPKYQIYNNRLKTKPSVQTRVVN